MCCQLCSRWAQNKLDKAHTESGLYYHKPAQPNVLHFNRTNSDAGTSNRTFHGVSTWRVLSPAIWHPVVWEKFTDVTVPLFLSGPVWELVFTTQVTSSHHSPVLTTDAARSSETWAKLLPDYRATISHIFSAASQIQHVSKSLLG
jgi:hypothetical protein